MLSASRNNINKVTTERLSRLLFLLASRIDDDDDDDDAPHHSISNLHSPALTLTHSLTTHSLFFAMPYILKQSVLYLSQSTYI